MPDTHNRSLVAATSGCAGIVLVSVCSCPLPQDIKVNLATLMLNWTSNCQCVVLKNHTLSAQSSGFQKDWKFLLNLSLHQKEEQSIQTECRHVGGLDRCSNQDSQTFFSSSVRVFFLISLERKIQFPQPWPQSPIACNVDTVILTSMLA